MVTHRIVPVERRVRIIESQSSPTDASPRSSAMTKTAKAPIPAASVMPVIPP